MIYDRKKHPFSIADMVRIGKSLANITTLPENARGFNDILDNYFSEESVSFAEWLDWLDIAIDFFGTVLMSPRFKIKGPQVAPRGFLIPLESQEDLVARYAVRKLRDAATTIEGS